MEQAVARIAPLVDPENVIVATGAPIRDAIVEANLVPEANVWAEPSKKNTLGCLSWAAANFEAGGKNPTWAVLTADHSISDEEAFRKCVEIAFSAAEQTGGLVTLGIPPSRPDTGFGYIEVGETVGPGGLECRAVSRKAGRDHCAGIPSSWPVSLEQRDVLLDAGRISEGAQRASTGSIRAHSSARGG
ncbi:MAG: Alginate biosynthesis protein AlgA, partial [Armatimonadetes bacterium OLB18]